MSTTRIRLSEGEVELLGPEDASVPAAEEEITVIVVVGQHVGIVRPGPIAYDWFMPEFGESVE